MSAQPGNCKQQPAKDADARLAPRGFLAGGVDEWSSRLRSGGLVRHGLEYSHAVLQPGDDYVQDQKLPRWTNLFSPAQRSFLQPCAPVGVDRYRRQSRGAFYRESD
jgi:hypothetical protein